ncbi:rod shape-determining protein RodA [Novosphingobium flavum]|uniref:rod shape-determining protein RodA n=1 Tax=Novosphingobium aerophilum TaxID=2839843 RepID=UPI00163A9E17|nr:rod shape-determining protein RodA [Novosphingobium aerophilum]MBC2660510.1 rod shape-determining protein RodA [Novosphingobium aerophilum]
MSTGLVPDPVARQPWTVILPLLALVTFGATVLYSAAGGSLRPWALTHFLRFIVFLAMAIVISRVRKETFKQLAYPIYGLTVLLLVLVELIGGIGGGSQRWLNLGFMTLQPSELMKPVIVLVLARFYDDLPPSMTASWRALVPAAALLVLPAGLVMIQPDLGTGLAISFGAVVVVFLAGVPLWWFIAAGTAALVAAPVAFFTLLHDYQRQRVFVFLDPAADPLGTGYHILQSTIAIGSGGLMGKGFGNGSQSHLDYLPEAHTDFVFATMAEEWGMLGGLFVIGTFAWVLGWGWRVALSAPDRFAQLLAGGMVFTMFFYVCINLMMVMGLAPVVGIPLPFMSHGGSSMMTNMICVGTIMAVANWSRSGARTLA